MFEKVLNTLLIKFNFPIFKQEVIKINFPLDVQCDTEATICRRFSRKLFLKILEYSQENTCVGGIFNSVAGLKTCNFIKKRLQHRHFPVNIAKFSRTAFFIEHLQWLLPVINEMHVKMQCNTINNFKRTMRTLRRHEVLRAKKKFWTGIPAKALLSCIY